MSSSANNRVETLVGGLGRTGLPDNSQPLKAMAQVGRLAVDVHVEPAAFDIEAWFAEMDAKGAIDFLEGWERDQPPMPSGKASFE